MDHHDWGHWSDDEHGSDGDTADLDAHLDAIPKLD